MPNARIANCPCVAALMLIVHASPTAMDSGTTLVVNPAGAMMVGMAPSDVLVNAHRARGGTGDGTGGSRQRYRPKQGNGAKDELNQRFGMSYPPSGRPAVGQCRAKGGEVHHAIEGWRYARLRHDRHLRAKAASPGNGLCRRQCRALCEATQETGGDGSGRRCAPRCREWVPSFRPPPPPYHHAFGCPMRAPRPQSPPSRTPDFRFVTPGPAPGSGEQKWKYTVFPCVYRRLADGAVVGRRHLCGMNSPGSWGKVRPQRS